MCGGAHGVQYNHSPIIFARAGMTNPAVLEECTEEDLVKFFVFGEEAVYWENDMLSRKYSKLIKSLYVVDLTNISWRPDRKFLNVLGESSKISAKLHPQNVRRQCMINAGWVFCTVWKVLRLFVSAETAEKVSLCTGFKRGGSASACPYASKLLDTDQLPTFAGGNCDLHDGFCVGGVHSDFTGVKNS
jgi:hypothetical protein